MAATQSHPRLPKKLRIALVCDWLTNQAGAERILLELHKMFPDAPIYTSVHDPARTPDFKDADIRTSFLQKVPFHNKHQLFTIPRMLAFRRFNFSQYDIVLSVTAAEAKFIKVKKPTIHICYCNTPTRYFWSHYKEYAKDPGLGRLNPIAKRILPMLISILRKIDFRAAQGPDFMIGNSNEIVRRIKKYYKRPSVAIFPLVDVERFSPRKKITKEDYYLIGSRLVPYKRPDLAVQACTELGRRLIVLSDGPEYDRLVKMAGPTIEFKGFVDDDELPGYYQKARAFIFPPYEDFGIVPVEAMAAGTPVIAYGKGGVRDTVIHKKTGIFFAHQTVDSLKEAILAFEKQSFNQETLQKQAQKFDHQRFRLEITEYIQKLL